MHARYLHATHAENKMRTIGTSGGVIGVRGGWRADPFLIVEGLFDALSLASAGWAAIATIGRDADWLAEVSSGRSVWLACDAGRPGEAEAARLAARLPRAHTRRLPPPPRCKDWNTALGKLGPARISQWIAAHVQLEEHAS